MADLAIGRPMSHRAGPQASAPELAIAYWNSVTERLNQMNAGRERIWDQVQAGIRGFVSSDDGLEEEAQLRMGFRLPLDMTPEQLKRHLHDLANGHELRFHGEEAAFRAEKNTSLVRALLGGRASPRWRARLRGEDGHLRHECGCPAMAVFNGSVWTGRQRARSHPRRTRGGRRVADGRGGSCRGDPQID